MFASWGLYTKNAVDASTMAWDLGNQKRPILHIAIAGQYPHYHVNNYLLFDKHKHFHVWYGEMA